MQQDKPLKMKTVLQLRQMERDDLIDHTWALQQQLKRQHKAHLEAIEHLDKNKPNIELYKPPSNV